MRTSLPLLLCCVATLRVATQPALETIPLTRVDHFLFVDIRVNEHTEPLHFLFDTGAGVTVVHTAVAEKLQLTISGESSISTAGKSVVSQESAHNTLHLGQALRLDSIELILMDLTHLRTYFDYPIDGVIGYDLLARYVTETRIDAQEMRLYAPADYTYTGPATGLELTTLESNLFGILIDVTPDKRSEPIVLNCEIDTGAGNYLTLHPATVSAHELIDARKRHKKISGFGAEATVTTNLERKIAEVHFGGQRWKKVPTTLEVDPVNHRRNSLADGLIGQRLLLDFNIVYDLPRRRMYLEVRK